MVEIDFSAIQNVNERIRTEESKLDQDNRSYELIKYLSPAELSVDKYNEIKSISYSTYRATGCRDYARIDLRLRDGLFYILDVNHNADLSPDASLSLSARTAGFSHGEFLSYLINLAAQRHPMIRKGG